MIRRYPALAYPPWRPLVYPERARRRAASHYLLSFHTDSHSAPVTPLFLTLSSKTGEGEGGARPTFHLSLLPSAVYLFFATLQNPSEPRFSSSELPLPRKVRSAHSAHARPPVGGQSTDHGSIRLHEAMLSASLFQLGLPEIQAAAARHSRIAIEKTIGMVKKYRQLRYATTAKQSTNPHALCAWSRACSGQAPRAATR